MTVLQELKSDFPRKIRESGEDYCRRRVVNLISAEQGRLRSIVQGTYPYNVKIDWDEDAISYQCSCPYFEDRDQPCKHIWATLCAADAQGKLPQEPGNITEIDEEADEDSDEEFSTQYRQVKVGDRTMTFLQFKENHAKNRNEPVRHAVWRRRLNEVRTMLAFRPEPQNAPWPADKQIFYVINAEASRDGDGLCIELCSKQGSKAGALKRLRLDRNQIAGLPEAIDRQVVGMLVGATSQFSYNEVTEVSHELWLRGNRDNELVRMMCQTGRCMLRPTINSSPDPLRWDDGEPWKLHLAVVAHEPGKTYRLEGSLRRGEERIGIPDTKLIVAGGPVFIGETACALEDYGAGTFISLFNEEDQLVVPIEQADDLIAELTLFPRLPILELPEAMAVTEVRLSPKPRLTLSPPGPGRAGSNPDRLHCRISFAYADRFVAHDDLSPAVFDAEQRRIIYRDLNAEAQALAIMRELGFRLQTDVQTSRSEFRLLPRLLPAAVRELAKHQWHVEVNGKVYRQAGKMRMEVSSGIDWFELKGEAEFDGVLVPLPTLLRAVSKGETTIMLDDGTVGIMPETWLKRYGLLAAVAEVKDEAIQFTRNQVGILDALMADLPSVNVDEQYARAREELRRFDGIQAIPAPESFIGSLRPYQSEGLGWFKFLRAFGLNGCLADDMGLGKTVQVLALLEDRRLMRAAGNKEVVGPSLVVVPRSLIFNWHDEAARFTPDLRVLDHASADRLKSTTHFKDYDVILTTYGTLRNDIVSWRELKFDYVILDEAQAIKNSNSESAKAARLLNASHRLALSGTPVQNHLGELWSLLEFLNPGMLGASRAFAALTNSTTDRSLNTETRQLLAGALRPFILRRTKEQVAADLPEKFEQTIFCELDKTQRALYDELKEHYRQSLLGHVDQNGINKSKLQILEALLRLRQAACHPGLINKLKLDESSAKLDTLLPRLAEVADEGHKAIVFSQFTSLLAIVRKRLDEQGTIYEYLDGKTRDRQQRVARFQTDPTCKLFLVSLKAGGVGLNLTAAQYVFLLDPWWNPAVESQAIDRAHRIGQTKQVFAYRLIAKDTVEEKVLKLQQSKRELADAIINADNAVISKLGREDLEMLLA